MLGNQFSFVPQSREYTKMKYAVLILLVALALLLIAGPADASFLSTLKKIVSLLCYYCCAVRTENWSLKCHFMLLMVLHKCFSDFQRALSIWWHSFHFSFAGWSWRQGCQRHWESWSNNWSCWGSLGLNLIWDMETPDQMMATR